MKYEWGFLETEGYLKARVCVKVNEFVPQTHDVNVRTRKADIRLPGKGDANSHGARPVY